MATLSIEKEYTDNYNDYKDKRGLVFGKSPIKKVATETNSAFNLRLVLDYEAQHKRTGDELDKACEAARDAGVKFLKPIFSNWSVFEAAHRDYLKECGYSEIANVCLLTMPLEVLNWKVIQEPEFNDVALDNWRNVILLNLNSSPTRNPFYTIYSAMADKDPFPTRDMNAVDKDVKECKTPASLVATAKKHGIAGIDV